jgi:hypothetical protein
MIAELADQLLERDLGPVDLFADDLRQLLGVVARGD